MDPAVAKRLTRNNWLAAAAHLLSFITLVILYAVWPAAQTRSSADTFRYQIAGPAALPGETTPTQCTTEGDNYIPGKCNIRANFQQPKKVASFNVIYGAMFFFLFTAAAHFFYASDGVGTGSYSRAVASGWNPYRWFEYAASASVMTALIALVQGTRDTSLILVLALATAAMQFCGFSVESQLRGVGPLSAKAKDSVVGSTIVGWLLFVAIWGALIYGFASVVQDVNDKFKGQIDPDTNKNVEVPAWIWYIVIAQLLYYASFGAVQFWHIWKRFKNDQKFKYADAEGWYIQLSFWAKLSLASGIGYGLLFRVKDCPA
jgi:hypothetical protein